MIVMVTFKMKKRYNMKNEKGVTLVALAITIIILIMIAVVGIKMAGGIKGDITTSKDSVYKSDLGSVQQMAFETYIKYKQTGSELMLKGNKISYEEAANSLSTLNADLVQKQTYNTDNTNAEIVYYRLNKNQLKEMGIVNIDDDADYIVNYYTGEAWDNAKKTISTGEPLYLYKD